MIGVVVWLQLQRHDLGIISMKRLNICSKWSWTKQVSSKVTSSHPTKALTFDCKMLTRVTTMFLQRKMSLGAKPIAEMWRAGSSPPVVPTSTLSLLTSGKKFIKYIEKMKLFQDDNLVLLNYHIDKNVSQFDAEHSQRWNTACPSPSTQNVLEIFLSPLWVTRHGVFKHPVDLQLLSLKLIFFWFLPNWSGNSPPKKVPQLLLAPKMENLNLLERKNTSQLVGHAIPRITALQHQQCIASRRDGDLEAASTENPRCVFCKYVSIF